MMSARMGDKEKRPNLFRPKNAEKSSRNPSDSAMQKPSMVSFLQRSKGNQHLQSTAQHQQHDQIHPTIQRKCACGGTCAKCAAKKEEEKNRIQTKLTLGPANDRYEQEADRVAAQIMGMPDSALSAGKRNEDLASGIQRMSSEENSSSVSNADINLNFGNGRALSDNTQQFMSARFGLDFSHVRIHNDQQAHESAAQIHAKAFTSGHHICLGKGAGENDKGLMAHELTHVIQQGAANPNQSTAARSSGLKESDEMQGDTEPDIEFLYANGTTTCVFPGGTPSSTVTNPRCTSVCTTEHEAKHYSDISPCCAAAGTAYRAASAADKPGIRSQFFTWMNANRSYFECRAYAVSVACADREIAAKDCNGSPAPGDATCCANLASYRADKESRRVSNCAGGPTLSACPFP